MANKNLTAAKNAKNDEFYTRIEDIQKELYNYPNAFVNKIVYLNCDDGEWSNFWRYFYQRFHSLKLKKLIATSYKKDGGTYKYEFEGNGTDYVNYMEGVTKILLKGDGDFRSDECIEILKQADIVVTNPPFSLFREYIAQLMEYEKKFLVIGNKNAITVKDIFPIIKNNNLWLGFSVPSGFEQPKDAEPKSLAGLTRWYTNLDHNKRHHPEEYYEQYSKEKYPKYDNYDAIEVSKTKDIPCDWNGIIGVPLTFIDKFCPEQFEILWQACGNTRACAPKDILNKLKYEIHPEDRGGCPVLNGERKYTRLFIRWKPEAMPKIINGVAVYNKENINGKQKSDRCEGGKE